MRRYAAVQTAVVPHALCWCFFLRMAFACRLFCFLQSRFEPFHPTRSST